MHDKNYGFRKRALEVARKPALGSLRELPGRVHWNAVAHRALCPIPVALYPQGVRLVTQAGPSRGVISNVAKLVKSHFISKLLFGHHRKFSLKLCFRKRARQKGSEGLSEFYGIP